MEITTLSGDETASIGALLGNLLPGGVVVLLYGDLGAGKTRFAQGVARGLGVPEEYRVTSPTYTLLNIYPGRLPLYHFDLYRLSGVGEVIDMGFDDYFYGQGVCLVEWSERLGSDLPGDAIAVVFQIIDEGRRRIVFTPSGERSARVLALLGASLPEPQTAGSPGDAV